jgi:hypothetical protein
MGTGLIDARDKMPVPHGKNRQGLVAVSVGAGRGQTGMNCNIPELTDALDSILHELGFCQKLPGIIKMLPLASATFLENGTGGSSTRSGEGLKTSAVSATA